MHLFILLLRTWTSDTQSRCSVYFGATWQKSFVFLFLCLPPKCRRSSRFCLLSLFLDVCVFLWVDYSTHFKLLSLEGLISQSNLSPPNTPWESSFPTHWGTSLFICLSGNSNHLPVAVFRFSSSQFNVSLFSLLPEYKPHYFLTYISLFIIPDSHKIQPLVCLWHWYLYLIFYRQNCIVGIQYCHSNGC